ncbi:hypothetical protein CFBP5507_07790 [Agrobacterium salinitolerans]|uniref:Uncharacterized protein n=1 Tax=Agrobacterium salinitolerans TaxID=1183413 RepID=A0A4Z1R5Q8_9HYPH|nr:hypothetical protein [Agrobacterium salinitolerans]UYZ06164.1 hypothetical protein CFBP5507_07790 [Agrobacterium salinitolerans]
MVENPYPIPRQLRLSDILVGDGGDTYGPFDFEIFDPADVVACICPANGLRFVEVPGIVVTKVNGNTALNPLDNFTVRFPFNVESTTRYVVLSSRVAARDAGVISGTRINPDALEKEFSKIATQQQELRRDIGRAIMTDFGAPSFTLDASIDDGRTLMKAGDRLVAGPDIVAIGDRVENVKDLVEGWASDIVSQGNVPIYAARVGVPALVIPEGINAFRVNGFWSAGDGGQSLYKKVNVEPGHPGKVRSADGAWWEIADAVLNVRMFGARMDVSVVDTSAVRDAMQVAFAQKKRVVKLPGGVISFSGIDMTLYKGVSLVSDTQDSVYIVPDANGVTIFSDNNPSPAGSNFTLGPFSIMCEIDGVKRTGVTGVHAVNSNRIVLDHIKFYGCETNWFFDRGGLHRIEGCVGTGTATLKAGKVYFGSTDDALYGAVFCDVDYRIDNSGAGVQSPAVLFRRCVATKGTILTNNSDYTGDCVVIENDCQGLDLNILGVAYERSLVVHKGTGVDKAPIFNTVRLEADQNGGTSFVMLAGRQNSFDVMITSSANEPANAGLADNTGIYLFGGDVQHNRISGRVSGFFDPVGAGLVMVSTVGTEIDLSVSGCGRALVDGGGNTKCDIRGDVSEANTVAIDSGASSPFAGVGNRIHDLRGYSGASRVASPAVPASGVPITNATGHDVQVFIRGGAVNTLTVRGQGVLYASGIDVLLKPGDTLAWNGTSAPTWNWVAF